ncbi:stage II sporulation protein M [Priestia filamentosa]|uniref:stage II sporulation protein M n=1 Tax=Priestia filamentosa TaxID=1402861 RepID=UPI003982644E
MNDQSNSLFIKELDFFKSAWREHKKTFWKYWVFVIVTIILSYLAIYLTFRFTNLDVKEVFSKMGGGKGVTDEKDTYWEGTVSLFKNNWTVCLQILLISFIPIGLLYNVSLLLSSLTLGAMIGIAQVVGVNLFETIVLGVLPHSVLELSVFIITAVYARQINKILVGKLINKLRRNKKSLPSFRKCLKSTIISFVFLITPLIFVAAVIEGYLTRFLFT